MAEDRRLLHGLCRAGIQGPRGTEAVSTDGLQAFCSTLDAAIDEADTELLAAEAGRHHAIVRHLFEAGPVLPIRFGTIIDLAEVPALLKNNAADIAAELDRLAGAAEWGIKLIAESETLVRLAEQSSASIRAIDEELAASTPGRAYLLKRKREAALAEAVEQHAAEVVNLVAGELAAVSIEQASLPPPSVIPADGQLLANLAFLVADRQADEFATEVDRLATGQAVELEVSGPWPPYSFVRLSLGGSKA